MIDGGSDRGVSMAMVKCSECKAQISSKASACPQCGAKVSSGRGAGCLLFVVAIIGIGIYSSNSEKKQEAQLTPEQKQAKERQDRNAGVAYACQRWVRESLRDPDSAEFLLMNRDVPVTAIEGGFTALLRVRAANGFGGKTVSDYVCNVGYDGSNYRLRSLNELR